MQFSLYTSYYLHFSLFVITVYFIIFYFVVYIYTDDSSVLQYSTNEIETFLSHGKRVHVLKAPNSSEKTKVLARLVRDMNRVVEWCVLYKYPNEQDSIRLKHNWLKLDIHETTFKDHVAYVVDKNKDFKLCVTTPNGEHENENTMRFVVLHEMAHMMSSSYGHNIEFNNHFINLLRVAVHLNVYTPEMSSLNPVTYCGTTVSSSPCESVSCNVLE